MKRMITALLSLGLAFSGIVHVNAQSKPKFAAGSTMERLAKAPTLRIGVKYDQPLFGLRDLSGQPTGFDVELGKLIAAKLGFTADKITWVEAASTNREPFLQQGKVDFVIATYAITDRRRQVINFAGPYIVGGQILMVKKGNPLKLKGPNDLAGRKACVINSSTGQNELLTNYKQVTVVPFDVISKCAEALKNGSVDAVVSPSPLLGGLVSRDSENFELVGHPFVPEPWGIGMPKAGNDLCQFVSNVLTEADRDGTYAKIYDSVLKPYLGGDGKLPPLDLCPA
jgi:glutamate transport system substrate-binding protein